MIHYKTGIATLVIAALSIGSAHAAIIDHGTYTTDTVSGLDWLDLTETVNMSYDDVIADGTLSGWRHASQVEVSGFFDAFGGSGTYTGLSTANNGLFDLIAPLWGDLYHELDSFVYPNPGDGQSIFVTEEVIFPNIRSTGTLQDYITQAVYDTQDNVNLNYGLQLNDEGFQQSGHALVRISDTSGNVPEPTTFALLSMGLLGAMRLNRRKRPS